MIQKLILDNFRGYSHHEVDFSNFSIIIGVNNAGKSTLVEALRLISIVVNRRSHLTFHRKPAWLEVGLLKGVSPSKKNIGFGFDTIFHSYENPPCKIEAQFKNGCIIRVYIGPSNEIYAVLFQENGSVIDSQSQAKKLMIDDINILPQVGPLLREETILNEEYVRNNVNSVLSSIHFRNQLLYYKEFYEQFCYTVQETWPSVKIMSLINDNLYSGTRIFLEVRNDDFVAEIFEMGHGLQIWLQIIWFLVRINKNSTIILDEPDVYLHADLQRKLIKYLEQYGKQVIITSHSVEMLSEVEPQNIVILDKKKEFSVSANSIPTVQRLVNTIGSIQNIQLTKLWYAKKLILVEGKDIKILNIFHKKLFPDSKESLESLPHMSIGGWGCWSYAIGSSLLITNSMGENIIPYCIFDRDYHLKEEIIDRYKDGKEKNIRIHIWKEKEIENYLFSSVVICRFIMNNCVKNIGIITENIIITYIKNQLDIYEPDLLDSISSEIKQKHKKYEVSTCNKEARKIINNSKSDPRGLLSLVPGKDFLSKLSSWSQENFGVSISATALANCFEISDIDDEIKMVVIALDRGDEFIN